MAKKVTKLEDGPVVMVHYTVLFGQTVEVQFLAAPPGSKNWYRPNYDAFGRYRSAPHPTVRVAETGATRTLMILRHEFVHAALDLVGSDCYAEGKWNYHAKVFSEEKIACLGERVLPAAFRAAQSAFEDWSGSRLTQLVAGGKAIRLTTNSDWFAGSAVMSSDFPGADAAWEYADEDAPSNPGPDPDFALADTPPTPVREPTLLDAMDATALLLRREQAPGGNSVLAEMLASQLERLTRQRSTLLGPNQRIVK